MYYNTELAEKAGLLSGDQLRPMQGADQVVEAFAAMKEATGQYGVSFEARGVTPWRMWLALYGQQEGGPLFNEEGTEFTMDDEKGLRALEFMGRLAQEGLVPSDLDYPASVAFFSNGVAGFHLNGEWEVSTFQAQEMPFNMVPLPQVFETQATQGDQHAFVIPAATDRPQERLDAAIEFIAGMLDRSLTWAKGGHVPSWRPVLESQEYRELSPQSNYASAAENLIRDPLVWFSGSGSDLENEAGAAFQTVLGGASPESGLRQFRAAMEQFLDKPSPV
jgi:multiple sugar transport system substrate-binding protein